MYFLLKEDSLQEERKTFVTGGLGVDYRDSSTTIRHVTNKLEEALSFQTHEDASQYLCRGYVVVRHEGNNVFTLV